MHYNEVMDDLKPKFDLMYPDEFDKFHEEIMKESKAIRNYVGQIHKIIFRDQGRPEGMYKNGHTKTGVQKYIRPDRTFSSSDTTDKIVLRTRLSYDIWDKFIFCMILDLSLRKTADICDISTNTAFSLRHKICHILESENYDNELTSSIIADETFFRINMKGPWHKPMPREPRRALDTKHLKRGLSKEQVCVLTALDSNRQLLIQIIGQGVPSLEEIEKGFKGKVKENSTLFTDRRQGYSKACENLKLKHRIAEQNSDPSSASPDLNLINSVHANLKTWMRRFKGVSTKHLSHYLAWFKVIKFPSNGGSEKGEVLCKKHFSDLLKVSGTLKQSNISKRDWPVNIWIYNQS